MINIFLLCYEMVFNYAVPCVLVDICVRKKITEDHLGA